MKKEAQDESPSALEEIGERRLARRTFLKGALATAPLLFIDPSRLWAQQSQPDEVTGPSTTTEPYIVPSIDGVEFVSILTVGDAVGKYRMVGIPDGLGAFENGRGMFTLLMNHELGGTDGAVH